VPWCAWEGLPPNFHSESIDLGCASPKLARTNNRDFLYCLHIEKVAIDADQQRAGTGNRRAQHWQIGGISTKLWRQIGGLYTNANATKESADLIGIALRKIEFLNELSPEFLEDEIRNYQLMV
jgi:hypothetical protein